MRLPLRPALLPGAQDRDGPLVPLLIVLTLLTGVVDATSYLSLGHVFVANMTGNVVFLGFAIAGAGGLSVASSLIALAAYLAGLAATQGVGITTRRLARFEPVRFDARLVRQIEAAAQARALATRRMTSGAGHDAQMIARICPAAMIFVPSVRGISHNPREHTERADLRHGANVLLDVLWALADEP